MSRALLALAIGAFGIGVTEFVIMGLLVEVAHDLSISVATAGTLISGYALGVVFGAPVLTVFTAGWPRKRTLLALMLLFTLGNACCALAPSYPTLLAARALTALTHGTFFGVGSLVARDLVAPERQASAISIVFTGLTVANVLGVPLGTWLGQATGWRTTFVAVAVLGLVAFGVMQAWIPRGAAPASVDWRADLQVLRRPPVVRGLLLTVLGFAGVFTVFTFVAPWLTGPVGLSTRAVSPVMLVFGGGLVVGNLLGGRFADRALVPTVLATLAVLGLVLLLMAPAVASGPLAISAVFALGVAGFATVAPLQTWVLSHAGGAGRALASSVNIAAFNLGNAIGAWAGGAALDGGLPLEALPLLAATFPLAALGLAAFAVRRDALPHQTA